MCKHTGNPDKTCTECAERDVLRSALRECIEVLKNCHETINGAVEMDVVEELSCDTMNAAHLGSFECIKKYSHLLN